MFEEKDFMTFQELCKDVNVTTSHMRLVAKIFWNYALDAAAYKARIQGDGSIAQEIEEMQE